MTAYLLILALLGPHTHATAGELGAAIDAVCACDHECTLDAVATCYMETRCQLGLCGRNGCGPFQQLPRYVSHEALVGMGDSGRRAALRDDAQLAAEQWKLKRDRYKARFGARWPARYNGSARAEQYLDNWTRVRARAEGVR